MRLPRSRANIKLKDVPRTSFSTTQGSMPSAADHAVYSRALFSPEEVARLRKRFSKLDFVRSSPLPSRHPPLS